MLKFIIIIIWHLDCTSSIH